MKPVIQIRTIGWSILFLLFCFTIASFPVHAEEAFHKKNMVVTLDDSTHLSTDVYLPAAGTSHPAILIRTPYGKHQHAYEGEFLASNGYAVIIQDTRGKWESDGEYIPFLNERNDGLQTVDWIVSQEWSNGEIGLWGSSYLSYCAIVIATAKHEAVKGMFIISGWLQGDKIINPGGSMHLMLNLAWILHEETQRVRSIQKYDMEALFQYLPLSDVFGSIGIESKIWTREQDLRSMNADLSASQIDIPVYHVSGWNDFVCNAALDIYRQCASSGENEHRLLIGPWFHDQLQTDFTEVGDEDFGEESILGREKLNELSLQWFDHILSEKDAPQYEKDEVKVFVMGENKWREFAQWPPENVQYQKWYLSNGEGANSLAGDGKLSPDKPKDNGTDIYIFDPMNPVPTYGGANFHFFLHIIGVKDQAAIEEREDVLVYTSGILDNDLDIIGPLKVILHASTGAKDTDFTAKLVEVRKDGYARIIQEGIIRASYRNSTTQRELLEPGEIYNLEIDLGSTAIKIPAGSRLRVEISSSNFPKYDRNPNNGRDAFLAEQLYTAEQTIHHGKKYPSCIVLPVLTSAN